MVTEARREASRRNGRKSRGPKTRRRQGALFAQCAAARVEPAGRPRSCTCAADRRVGARHRGAIAGKEQLDMALIIAAAHVEVIRARRARVDAIESIERSLDARMHGLRSSQEELEDRDDTAADTAAIKRALAAHRYEERAFSRRKFAIRQFDAAFPAYGGIASVDVSVGADLKSAHVADARVNAGAGFQPARFAGLRIDRKGAGLNAPTTSPEIASDTSGYCYKGFGRTSPKISDALSRLPPPARSHCGRTNPTRRRCRTLSPNKPDR